MGEALSGRKGLRGRLKTAAVADLEHGSPTRPRSPNRRACRQQRRSRGQESPSTTSPPPLPRTSKASHGHVRASREYHPRLEQVATGSGTTHGWLRRHDAAISRSVMTSGRLRVCVTRYTSRSRSSSDTVGRTLGQETSIGARERDDPSRSSPITTTVRARHWFDGRRAPRRFPGGHTTARIP